MLHSELILKAVFMFEQHTYTLQPVALYDSSLTPSLRHIGTHVLIVMAPWQGVEAPVLLGLSAVGTDVDACWLLFTLRDSFPATGGRDFSQRLDDWLAIISRSQREI